jgi:hypothetical protein
MKVHLVFAPTTYHLHQGDLGKGMEPSLGVLYLASYLREFGPKGIEIIITDGLLEGFDKTLEEVLNAKADVVGISAGTTNIMGAYRLTREIKGSPARSYSVAPIQPLYRRRRLKCLPLTLWP